MPQVEPALEVLQPANLVRRNVGHDRLQAASRPQQVALGIHDPRQFVGVQDVAVVDRSRDHSGGLLAGQPLQRLHQHVQVVLGELGFDRVKAVALCLLKGRAARSPSTPLR